MKLFTYVISSLGLMACFLSAQDKPKITAIPVTVKYSSGLPDDVSFGDGPFYYKKGLQLTFLLQGNNIMSVDEKSFKAEGWVFQDRDLVTNGKSVNFNLYNEGFKGNLDDVKLSAAIEVMYGISSKTRKIFFKKGDKPIKFLGFTVEVNQRGVKVVGEHEMIKSISVVRDGREKFSRGYRELGKTKTFTLEGIKDTDEISLTYWTEIKVESVKLVR